MQEFHKRVSEHIKVIPVSNKPKLDEFLKLCTYIAGKYDEAEPFKQLTKHLESLEDAAYKGDRNRIFYMALPPSVFTDVATNLKQNCYSSKGVNRIIVEKPFGKDLDSSREMQSALKQHWKEEEVSFSSLASSVVLNVCLDGQIFRIDHYLGKEMVKNILVLRFGNVILDSSFNKQLVSNVQITFKEPFGTEGRGGYFDEFGIIRDVMQNRASYRLQLVMRSL